MTERHEQDPARTTGTETTGPDGLPTWPADQHPPLNRAERRHPRNRKAEAIQDNMQSQAANEAGEAVTGPGAEAASAAASARFDPAYGRGGDDDGSFQGRPDQGVQHDTGAGSGGATESEGRLTHHEGMHLGNQPNS